mmetsp:Transcript_15587/g.28331  ORF Transcript_15587/g.28331 Transcript_15587/m.28331 type:complete len:439 (+) Transcript_15587:2858-4174(+)
MGSMNKSKGYWTVLGGFLTTLCCGSLNAWGMIVAYLASYLRLYDDAVSVSSLGIGYSFSFITLGFGLMLNVKLIIHIGSKLTCLVGVFCMSFGLMVCSFLTNQWLFNAVFSVFVGLGVGTSMMAASYEVCKHFTRNTGFYMGLSVVGHGLGPLVFCLLFTYICNPDNRVPDISVQSGQSNVLYFDREVAERVPSALIMCGLFIAVVGVLGSMLIYSADDLQPLDDARSSVSGDTEYYELTIKDVIKSEHFWLLFAAFFFGISFTTWIFVSFKNYGALYIDDDHFLAYIGVVGAVATSIARLIFPMLMDYFSFFALNSIAISAIIVLALSVNFAVHYKSLYMIVIVLAYFFHGSQFFPYSLICKSVFGEHLGPAAFSYVAWGNMLACIMTTFYYYILIPSVGYFWTNTLQAVFAMIGLMFMFRLNSVPPFRDYKLLASL